MTDVVNVLRALVANGTELVIKQADFSLSLTATKTRAGEAPLCVTRILGLTKDDDDLCEAIVEMYLQLRAQ